MSTRKPHLQDEIDVGGQGLDPVEAGDQGHGQEALLVHLPAQEEVPLQVVDAEVVFAAEEGGRRLTMDNLATRLCPRRQETASLHQHFASKKNNAEEGDVLLTSGA